MAARAGVEVVGSLIGSVAHARATPPDRGLEDAEAVQGEPHIANGYQHIKSCKHVVILSVSPSQRGEFPALRCEGPCLFMRTSSIHRTSASRPGSHLQPVGLRHRPAHGNRYGAACRAYGLKKPMFYYNKCTRQPARIHQNYLAVMPGRADKLLTVQGVYFDLK